MNITINTEVLQGEGLSLGDFLVLLIGYYDINYKETMDNLIDKGVIQPNLFNRMSMVLSNNSKNYISKLLTECNDKIVNSRIDFTSLAKKLQDIYPAGMKLGTTYLWRDNIDLIAQKLKTLIAKHGFTFTEEEAINATKEYVSSFKEDKQRMMLLKNFILRTDNKEQLIDSMFMTIIENNR